MPLAPGLGCGGLYFLNEANDLLKLTGSKKDASTRHQRRSTIAAPQSVSYYEEYETDEEGEKDDMQILSDQLAGLNQK
jgi:hypothetical protein